MFKVGDKVQTRGNHKARIIFDDAKGEYPVVALISKGDDEIPIAYTAEGKYFEGGASNTDLIPKPKTHTRYINVYTNHVGGLFKTRSDADCASGLKRTGCIKVELTEGQWDD